ncbi:hypothetical protein F4777DRAFT_558398 [Nemania sp. FL0916]|nr:hypothetical protein F4777DRAFT_558398 [Nemania sp. FL0916]
MSDSDIDSFVHIGLWTDWSHGSVLGQRLTLSRSNANLLVAFTAFFIAFVATRFWRVFCLVFHRCSSTSAPQYTLYYQKQVILRNSANAETGITSFFTLLWAWRKLGWRRLLSLLSLLVSTALILAGFTIAGGFSSQISSATADTVLLNPQKCGFVQHPINVTETGPLSALYAQKIYNAANYAQQCYLNNTNGLLNCDRFVADRISWVSDTNASCRFSDTICRNKQSNIRLDTGQVDTHAILGFNAPLQERSSSRYVLHCAPLVTEGYKSIVNTSDKGVMVRYNYGWSVKGGKTNVTEQNYTYSIPDIKSQYLQTFNGANFKLSMTSWATFHGETVGAEGSTPLGVNHGAIPELARKDADVHIIFLSGNGVVFDKPTSDPWYLATVVGGTASSSTYVGATPFWIPEEAASPLGCVEQFQYCNLARPNKPCGPLASFSDAVDGAAPLFNLTVEELTQERPPIGNIEGTRLWRMAVLNVYNPLDLKNLVRATGIQSLGSRVLTLGGILSATDATDLQHLWQLDVVNWFATLQAALQASYVDTVTGTRDALLDSWLLPLEGVEQEVCNGQKIRSSRYGSFNVFALLFTYIVGGVIVLLSILVEPTLDLLHRKFGYKSYQQLEWSTNEQLQLLRLAHEEAGHGT